MASSGYAITISATDAISGTLDRINKRFANMASPLDRLAKSTSKLGDMSGINALGRGITRVGSGMVDLARKTANVVTPLSAITGAASLAGIYHLTEAFGDFGSRLGNDARNIGATVDGLSSMQGAARLAGSSAGALTSGMTGLADSITDAIGGRNMEALQYFRQLGINLHNANGSAKTAQQALPEVANSIARIGDPRLQARVARAFGFSEDMLPALRLGAAGFARLQGEAARYGAVNASGAAAADQMRVSQTRLTLATENLGYAIAERLSPVLSPMLTGLAEWISAHRTDVADTIGNIAGQFKAWADGGGITKVWTEIKTFGGELENAWHGIDGFVRDTVGWKSALMGLAGVWTANQLGLTGFTTAMLGLTALKLPAWLMGLVGGSATAAIAAGAATLALHGDTDPNATADGFRTGWLPDNGPGSKGYDVAHGASNLGLRSEAGMDNMATRPSWWSRNAPAWAGGTPVSGAVPNEGRALLDAISAGESDGSYADQRNPKSGARGRYQFLDSTWREVSAKTGLYDFTPENQDRNAWFYAQERYRKSTGGDLSADMKGGVNPAYGLNKIWTSLPGGAEPNRATRGFEDRLNREMRGLPQAPTTPAAVGPYTPSAAPAAPPLAAAGANGTVKVDIVHSNAPTGTSSRVATTGDVTATSRIETAMPMMAFP